APQPDGAVPEGTRRALPAAGAIACSAQRPGRGVKRDLRSAAVAPGPGDGGVLRLHGCPRIGVAVGDPRRDGPWPSADHGDSEGRRRAAGAPGIHGRVRVAAALPGRDGGPDPEGTPSAAVVDAASAVQAADLSRGAPDVRAGRAGGRKLSHLACAAPYGGLP